MGRRGVMSRWTLGAAAAVAVGLLVAMLSASRAGGQAPDPGKAGLRTATFAGGCFWCMEAPFDALDGVVSTTSGYTGGRIVNPSYEQVSSGGTGHTEALQVLYDPKKVSYEKLLEVFWHNVDPLTANGQFCDRGEQYRTGIFWEDEAERVLAERTKREVAARLRKPVVTEIVKAGPFYPAEEYHQDYYKKNPVRYKFYRYNCGRDRRLQELWGEAASH
jgi:peptide-methionine (S)-S-oxide reductase